MSYNHPSMLPPGGPNHLRDLSNAMEYNAAGQPIIRVTTSSAKATNDGGRDAFGRLRVATPLTLFDAHQRYTKRDDLFDVESPSLSVDGLDLALTTLEVASHDLDGVTLADGD